MKGAEFCCECDGNKKEKTGGCFSSFAKVTLENGTSATMSDLQVGNKVQTGMDSVTMSKL